MTREKKFDRAPNRLHCYKCGNDDLSDLKALTNVVRRRRTRRGESAKAFDMVRIKCLRCRNTWFSMHVDAITLGKKLNHTREAVA